MTDCAGFTERDLSWTSLHKVDDLGNDSVGPRICFDELLNSFILEIEFDFCHSVTIFFVRTLVKSSCAMKEFEDQFPRFLFASGLWSRWNNEDLGIVCDVVVLEAELLAEDLSGENQFALAAGFPTRHIGERFYSLKRGDYGVNKLGVSVVEADGKLFHQARIEMSLR